MSVLWLPIGPPASGKSTLASQMVNADKLASDGVVSPDYYRRVLTGDIGDMGENALVFDLCLKIMHARLDHQLDVWLDATNTNPGFRSDMIATASLPGVVVVGIRMTTPVEECRLRNELRDRTVPKGPMEGLIRQYQNVDWSNTGVDLLVDDRDVLGLDYSEVMTSVFEGAK